MISRMHRVASREAAVRLTLGGLLLILGAAVATVVIVYFFL